MAAKTISVSSYQLKAAFNVLGLLCLLLLLQKGNAIQFNVGGAKGWNVNDAKRYNQWAEKTRFQIGDSLCKFPCICLCYLYIQILYSTLS